VKNSFQVISKQIFSENGWWMRRNSYLFRQVQRRFREKLDRNEPGESNTWYFSPDS